MVGLPPEQEDAQKPAQVAVAVLDPEPTRVIGTSSLPKKRGPKPKYGTAMTPAERQTRSRTNRKQIQDDAERRNQQIQDDVRRKALIAELMEIYDRQQANVVKTENKKATDERRAVDRKQRAQFHIYLMALPVEDLKLALETEKQAPDTHGRLPDERSGEGKRQFGQSEIERLLATRQHDSSLFEGEDQDPNLAGGFKVTPEGAAPESFDTKDSTVDTADKPGAHPPRIPTKTWERQKKTDEKMLALVHEAFDEYGHCHVPNWCLYDRTPCSFRAKNTDEALEHLWAEYHQGERLWDHVEELSDPDIADTVAPLLAEARKKAWANIHHWVIRQWLAKYRKKRGEPELRDMHFLEVPVDISPVSSTT